MHFEANNLYHIYNQGNNRQNIFFSRDNYLFFLRKVQQHILPYADVLAWCLMPNHFHLLVATKLEETLRANLIILENFNHSIGKMLSSYTRAINLQEERSGSLFRKACKAVCVTKIDGMTSSYFNSKFGTILNRTLSEDEYSQVCFDYIHENSVRGGLVKRKEDWEFSSYLDYAEIRNGTLVNKDKCGDFSIVFQK